MCAGVAALEQAVHEPAGLLEVERRQLPGGGQQLAHRRPVGVDTRGAERRGFERDESEPS